MIVCVRVCVYEYAKDEGADREGIKEREKERENRVARINTVQILKKSYRVASCDSVRIVM